MVRRSWFDKLTMTAVWRSWFDKLTMAALPLVILSLSKDADAHRVYL
ncbi:MAG TPA: hypothetical protein VIG32_07485 [Candidatus Baltobacteraceae bacterium]|jgi:hypothetical protein